MTKRREIAYPVKSEHEIQFALRWAESMIRKGLAAGEVVVYLGRARRNLDQNAKLWPMLTDISRQCDAVIDGVAQKATPEDWKDILTAAMRSHQRVAQGVDGGVVFLGMRTSKMRKAQFSELIELILAFGAERGVVWSEKSKQKLEELRPAA